MRRVASLLLVGACLSGCRGASQSVASDGRDFPHVADTVDRTAPSMKDLSAFTYSGTDAGTVTLTEGVWRGGAAGDPNAPVVELVKDFRLTGDITGNGFEEAVVLLESRRPPSALRTYLAVVGRRGMQLVNIATTPISDQIQVRGGRIEPGRIILLGVQRAPESAGVPPSPVQLTYELSGTTLKLSH